MCLAHNCQTLDTRSRRLIRDHSTEMVHSNTEKWLTVMLSLIAQTDPLYSQIDAITEAVLHSNSIRLLFSSICHGQYYYKYIKRMSIVK